MLSYTWECSQRSNKSIHSGKIFWCDQCEYKFTAKNTLNRHVEQYMRKESMNLMTESIKVHFRVLSRWNKSIHSRVMFGCDKCEYRFTEKNYSNQTYTDSPLRVQKGVRGEYYNLFMLKYSQGINISNYNSTNGKCFRILE